MEIKCYRFVSDVSILEKEFFITSFQKREGSVSVKRKYTYIRWHKYSFKIEKEKFFSITKELRKNKDFLPWEKVALHIYKNFCCKTISTQEGLEWLKVATQNHPFSIDGGGITSVEVRKVGWRWGFEIRPLNNIDGVGEWTASDTDCQGVTWPWDVVLLPEGLAL